MDGGGPHRKLVELRLLKTAHRPLAASTVAALEHFCHLATIRTNYVQKQPDNLC